VLQSELPIVDGNKRKWNEDNSEPSDGEFHTAQNSNDGEAGDDEDQVSPQVPGLSAQLRYAIEQSFAGSKSNSEPIKKEKKRQRKPRPKKATAEISKPEPEKGTKKNSPKKKKSKAISRSK